jgi:Uma2 family endonuclease
LIVAEARRKTSRYHACSGAKVKAMVTAAIARMTFEEFLAFEEASETKHDFINGEVFDWGDPDPVAMAGGTDEHSALGIAVSVELANALRGRRCRVYGSDMMVSVPANHTSFYPDVSVACSTPEFATSGRRNLLNPTIIVEVLSRSTERYDRIVKFEHYRGIPSLREYVLVSQHEPRIEVYRRSERGNWDLSVAGRGQRVELTSCGAPIELDVDAIYANPFGPT